MSDALIATLLAPPTSRMAPLTTEEFQQEFAESDLMREYGTPVDRESAAEMLAARLARSAPEPDATKAKPARSAGRGGLVGALTGTMARTIGRELVRALRNGRLCEVKGAAHNLLLERPDAVANEIARELAQ